MEGDNIKLYKLVRKKDISGMSGTGTVALLAKLPSGRVVLEWISSNHPSISIFNNLEDVEIIHGHEGASVIEPLDKPNKTRKKKLSDNG